MSIADDEFRKQTATTPNYIPRSFSLHEFETLKALCDIGLKYLGIGHQPVSRVM